MSVRGQCGSVPFCDVHNLLLLEAQEAGMRNSMSMLSSLIERGLLAHDHEPKASDARIIRAFISIQAAAIQTHMPRLDRGCLDHVCLYRCGLYRYKCP